MLENKIIVSCKNRSYPYFNSCTYSYIQSTPKSGGYTGNSIARWYFELYIKQINKNMHFMGTKNNAFNSLTNSPSDLRLWPHTNSFSCCPSLSQQLKMITHELLLPKNNLFLHCLCLLTCSFPCNLRGIIFWLPCCPWGR